ncbi:MAG: hypothetical protein LBI44_00215 [Oscillospiraceae bacterium]|jgi:hypothetical protein|nr:hypothetical protein [Oscillospiraceae bacterium]
MRAVIYARRATALTGAAAAEYIRRQAEECRAYAERSGMVLLGYYVDDNDLPPDARPLFKKMLADAAYRMFDCVITLEDTVLAETPVARDMYLRILEENGVRLLCANQAPAPGQYPPPPQPAPGQYPPPYAPQYYAPRPPQPQAYRRPQRAPRPPKTGSGRAENFVGQHIVAVLAGILITAAALAAAVFAWGNLPDAARFALLLLFGGALIAAALVRAAWLPGFLKYTVIRNIFLSAGLAVVFVTFTAGYTFMYLYPFVAANLLFALWLCGAFILMRFCGFAVPCLTGTVGVIAGCAVLSRTGGLGPVTAAVACVFLALTLSEYSRRGGKYIVPLYIYCSLSACAVTALLLYFPDPALPVLATPYAAAALIPLSAAGLLLAAKAMPVTGNIIYTVNTLAMTGFMLGNLGVTSAIADGIKPSPIDVYSSLLIAAAFAFAYLRPCYLPAALGLFTVCRFSFLTLPQALWYSPSLAALAVLLYLCVGRLNSLPGIALRRAAAYIGTFAALLLGLSCHGSALFAGEPYFVNIINFAALALAAYVLAVRFVAADAGFAHKVCSRLSAAVLLICAGASLAPRMDGGFGTILSSMLMGIALAVYLALLSGKKVSGIVYRALLFLLCAFTESVRIFAVVIAGFRAAELQGVELLRALARGDVSLMPPAFRTVQWFAFIGTLLLAAALFHRFVHVEWNKYSSVIVLWFICLQLFVWLQYLAPPEASVIPSIVVVAVGFASVLYGFAHKRNSARISGLVMVIAASLKASVVDVWTAHSLIRIAALLVGAGICLAISRLYAGQSSSLSRSARAFDGEAEGLE